MKRRTRLKQTIHGSTLVIAGLASTSAATDRLNADPSATVIPSPSYSRPGMAAYYFMMDDPLLGNSYEKPVWNLHDSLKLPAWLSLGVEQRTRYESVADSFKGSTGTTALTKSQGGDQMIALQSDIWLQAKFDAFRIAVEFLDARTTGQDNGKDQVPFPVNNSSANTLDFAQAYVSWADQNVAHSGLGAELKVGRQTMDLGSRRLVARPIFRNTVNNFTGLRARLLSYDNWQFNAFVTMPVLRYPNFNALTKDQNLQNHQQWDQEDSHTWFSGGIIEGSNLLQNINADLYLYHLDEGDSARNNTRNRHYFTPGLRIYQKPAKGSFDFQAEGMGQFGTVNYAATGNFLNKQQNHEAWSAHLEAGYSFDLPWSPRFDIEYDYATGSKNWKDSNGTDGRFDPLYGASDFDFGPTGIYGAFQRSNIHSPAYKIEFAPRHDLSFRLQHRLVWLASANDCWGGNTCTSATAPSLVNGNGSYVGDQIGITGRYNFNSSLNVDAGWYHLIKGDFAKSAKTTNANGGYLSATQTTPGADTDYFFVQSQLRF